MEICVRIPGMHGIMKPYASDLFEFYVECSDGFYGLPTRCKICPYPSYGAGCQSYCECKQESCNHVTGCSVSVSDNGIYYKFN